MSLMRMNSDCTSRLCIRAGLGFVVVVGMVLVVGCGNSRVSQDCVGPPKPARASQPSVGSGVAWLGTRYRGWSFYNSQQSGRSVAVNYGEPRIPDPCSGGGYRYAVTVQTSPLRIDTRSRIELALGSGVPHRLGTSYGCRGKAERGRLVILTTNHRISFGGNRCRLLRHAARALRIGP